MRKSGIYLILLAMLMSLSCNKDATVVAPNEGNGNSTSTTLVLTYPQGGEVIKANEAKTITWTSNTTNKLKLDFSKDGGATWQTIASNIANSLTYSWTPVDSMVSTTCFIRISDTVSSTVSVSRQFQVAANVKKTISVVAPVGGESIVVGGSFRIKWTSTNVSTVKLQYSTDAGSSWNVINYSVPADSQGYTWSPVPDAASTTCRVKVSDASSDTVSAISPANFTIYSTQKISIAKPAANDTMYIGSSYELQWTSTDVQTVKIELSTNNGTNWTTLIDNLTNTGSYIISSVPNFPSATCKLRISDALDGIPAVTTNYNFSILALPNFTITQPNGGEKIAAGSTYAIQWTSSSSKKAIATPAKQLAKNTASQKLQNANSQNVKIELSTNSGSTWSTIVASTLNTGSYNWVVDTSLSSTQCRIRISDAETGSPSDISNADFTIYKPVAQTVTLTSPVGGEIWEVGSQKQITWTETGLSYVKLEYSTDGGATFFTIATNVVATANTYSWIIPAMVSTTCKVRISNSLDATIYAVSKNNFAISPTQTIAITAPNGGEVITAGGSYNITWNSSYVSNVKIDYTTNNGVDWQTIVASTASNGFYTWSPVPNVSSTNCRIRISDASDGLPTVLSDKTFSILAQPTIRVVSPNGGERILAGSSYSITWVTSGSSAKMAAKKIAAGGNPKEVNDNSGIQKVKLEFTSDGGTSWNTIVDSTANNGSYIWNPVPNVNSALCRVRVSNSVNNIPSDVSDTVFVIYNQISQSITIGAPNGGESFTAGSSTNITWNSSGVAAVSIDFTTNNGVSWSNIVKNIASTGIYTWNPIPSVASNNCKIRIYDAVDSIPSVDSKATFTILPQPTVSVLTPNGGEQLSPGSVYNITWTSQAIGKVKLELTQNNGADWTTIADSVLSSGRYSWTVPNISSSLCKIRISNASGGTPSAVSANVFSISSQVSSSIRVTSPNGGETWTAGTSQNITWVSSGVDTVKIEFSTDNGINWSTIVGKTPSSGYYVWPSLPSINSSNCVVKISAAATGQPWDKSDTVFTIQIPTKLTVLSPNGGEHILAGTSYTIKWSSGQSKKLERVNHAPAGPAKTDGISNVRLDYSTDAGANWTSVITSAPNTGSYIWNPVPNVSSQLCRVRVSDVADASNSDISDSNFVIYNQVQKSITVTSPNGGESLTAGSAYSITWTSVAINNVSIQFSTNNGVNWSTIATNVASSGIYNWNPIPNVSSTNCKIRVLNADDSLLYDDSNAPFTVLPQPTVSVLKPNGGEQLQFGTPYTITWTSQAIAKVKLEFTINNGANWTTIADSVISSGSYSWSVPNVNSSLCKVRVSNSQGGTPSASSANVFSISNQLSQTIKVLKPAGGESWTAGTSQSVVWNSTGIDTVKIEYTTNNGVSWATVVSKTPSNGIYSWSIPNTVSANCRVRVSDAADGVPSAINDSAFSILAQPTIKVTSPNGSEHIVAGSGYTIQWTSTSQSIANVKIEFSIDGGNTYPTTIVSSTPNTGNYLWNPVPNVSSALCRIRVSDASNSVVSDFSDSNFVVSIQAAQTISVTAPNGGESISAGKSYPITWTSSGISTVGIDYSTNNGVNWTNIASNIASNGYYLWNPVPNVSSTNCKVRIYDAVDTLPVATSASQFTILPAPTITVLTPNGGEQLVSGTVKNITWTSSNIAAVKIQLTINNGASWTTIVDSTPSTGIYAWTVPAQNSSLCKVRISEKTTGSPIAESQNVFSIAPTAPQSVTVISPNGGESLAPATSYAIKWVSSGIDTVKIEVSTNNGLNWSTVVAKTPSSGVYIWSPIPSLNSTNCIIKVSDASDGNPYATSAAVFSVISQPTLTLTAPNGGDKILAGSSYTITWSTNYSKKGTVKKAQAAAGVKQPESPNDISNVKLELSTDDGLNWQTIIASTPNTGSYVWKPVTNANSALCRVRVSDASGSGSGDISDSTFIIYNQVQKSITVTAPNGGESLTAGGSYNITWTSSSVTAVSIQYTTNNGVNWTSVAANLASSGYFTWNPIPNVSSTNCKIRVLSADDSLLYDDSNAPFTILPQPAVTVLTPNGGEQLQSGTPYNITWTSQAIAKVKLEFTINNGANWTTITDSVTSSGSYSWTVPSVSSSLCKVRVSNSQGSTPSAVSANVFTISNQQTQTVKVVKPAGGESWTAGTTQNIVWNSVGIDTVKIEYTTNNGVNWTTVVAKTPSNGIYSWVIPNTVSANCKVRVSDASDGIPSATNDSSFTILSQPTIHVVSPNGSEHITAGGGYTIQWTSTSQSIANVKIEFSIDGGATYATTIVSSTQNTGTYLWEPVPNVSSTLCRIRISDASNANVSDYSDSNFVVSIQASQTITVNTPNGGEALTAGKSYPITWTSSGISTVGIDYSTNNGVNWTNVINNIASNGYYLWNPVPSVSSTNCKIRIYDAVDTLPVAMSASQFTILPAPTITVLAPNGGEQLVSGTVKNILWSSSNIVAVKIQYTTNNGASWVSVIDSTPSTGVYAWTVPSQNSNLCKIRISEKTTGSPIAESQNVFSITPTVPQSITMVSPNGGESLAPGTSYAIKWVSSGIDTVKIEVSTNNGVSWTNVIAKTPSNGVYIWSPVPSLNSTNCMIRVSDASDGNPYATSAAVFSVISQPTLTLTAPNGGDKILAGSSYTITWSTNYSKKGTVKKTQAAAGVKQPLSPNDISNVKLELSTDDGLDWQTIIASTPNTGSYVWKPVSNVSSSLCRVRVSDAGGSSAGDISDSSFVIYNTVAQTITVKTPAGSEVLTAGGSFDITWTSVSVTAVTIELSTNNGVNWSTLASNIPSNGLYHWSPIPNVSSTNCRIRISDAVDSIPSVTNPATFNIMPAPSIKVMTPKGGESYTGGQTVNVLWQSANIVAVKIDLTTNNGASWTAVVDSVPSNGIYQWTVPAVTSNLCKIRITEKSSGNPVATSDTTFSIATTAPQTIKVTSPNGGESFPAGSTQSLTWTSTGVDSVKIEYTTDNGLTWQTIISSTPSSGVYTWLSVPAQSSTNCKVRVSRASTGTPYDESDNVFTIAPQPAIKVIKPDGGEFWTTASTQTISWSSTNLTKVKIEFTTNNGASWTTIADSTPSTGAYSWIIPNLYSTLCKVRVSNPLTGLPFSVSDTTFTISNQVSQSLTITSPVGGEVWEGASSHNITWSSTAISKVKIEYTTDNGISWVTVADSVLSNGLYQWNPIPNTPSTLCMVRISNVSGGSPRDESKTTFTINPQRTLSITYPNGGESLTAGTKYSIKWNSSGVQNVNIYLRLGTDTTKIVTGAANSGSYDWSPTVAGSGYHIVITDGSLINPVVTESAGSFTVLPEPSISILAPNSNVQLATGSTYTIKWLSTNLTSVKLELTTNNGASWSTIVDSVSSIGSYNWTVPNYNSSLCKIRISNTGTGLPSKITDSTFTIYSVQPKTITVTAPNGGETYPAGSTQSITWTSTGIDSVKIEYTTDNGVNWQTIVNVTPSNGFYSWTPIPSLSSTNCKVRISSTAAGVNITGLSANVFTIAPQPAIKILKPDGGEVWTTGSTQSVQWQSTYLAKVKIEYTTNNGYSWTTITDSTASTGSYSWTIPNLNSSLCKVRVSNPSTGLPYSVSDSAFTISNQISQSISVTSPNGGEVWDASSAHNITWTSTAVSQVKIEYTTDNGITWTQIADSVTSNGLYQWNPVPNVAATLCKVRITGESGSPQAVSASPFTINPLKSITVTYPNGGESLTAGTLYALTWNSTGGIQTVNIDYRIGNAANWTSIVTGAPNNGTYNWSPSVASAGYKIRVTDAIGGTTTDESDGTFTVLPEPSITVLAPVTSVSLVAGSQYNIKWQSTNITSVMIDYTTNNGASWTSVTASTPSTGVYSWTVPAVSSSLCKIRISNITGLPSAVSDSAFTIYSSLPSSITVTAPVGGEKYPIGSSQTITWNSTGIATVNIEYSTDNGNTWNAIASNIASSGYYTWTPIPATLSSNCKIRVSSATGGFFYGTTPGTFSIIPQGSIKVLSPVGGESYISGSTQYIRWSSQNVANVTIQYSSDNGSTWNALATNIASTGLYTWSSIPVINSNQCRIKVQEATVGVPYDTSAANFSIVQSKQLRVIFPNLSTDVVSQDTTIIWYSVGVDNVKLELSSDNGQTWTTIKASTASTGAYKWTLPLVTSSVARIRVTDVTDATVTDMSDAGFILGFTPPASTSSSVKTGATSSKVKANVLNKSGGNSSPPTNGK